MRNALKDWCRFFAGWCAIFATIGIAFGTAKQGIAFVPVGFLWVVLSHSLAQSDPPHQPDRWVITLFLARLFAGLCAALGTAAAVFLPMESLACAAVGFLWLIIAHSQPRSAPPHQL